MTENDRFSTLFKKVESLVNTQQEVIAQTKMQLHFLRNNIKESEQNIHSMRKAK